MFGKLSLLISLVLVFALAGTASASIWWVGGGGDNYWSNASNWGPDDGDGYGFYVLDIDDTTALVDVTHSATAGEGARIAYYGSDITVNITGGSLTSDQTRIGYKPGTSGTINVSGNGSFINNSYLRMAYDDGSACTINLTDNATFDVTTYVRIGTLGDSDSNGIINITDDASMSVDGYFRSAYNGTSTVTVSGNGTLDVGDYYRVANTGTGVLTVKDNGVVDIINQLYVPASVSGTGTVNLQDGTIYTGWLDMELGTGLVDIWDGSLVIAGNAEPNVNSYISAGKIAAFGVGVGDPGFGTIAGVIVDYNSVADLTTVTAYSMLAYNPSPSRGEEVIPGKITLSWSAGSDANSHNVYFGTDFNDVNDANNSSAEFKGNQPVADVNFGPVDCEVGQTYYWRIDEVNSVTYKGIVWDFKRVIDPEPKWDDGELGSSLWSDANNWNSDVLPGPESTAHLDLAGSTCLISTGIDANCTFLYGPAYYNSNMTLNVTGGSLTTIASIRTAYNENINGTINVSGDGAVNVGSHIRMAYDVNSYAELNISGSGIVNVDEYVRMAYEPNADATIDISNNGSLNIDGYLRAAYSQGSYSTVNISGSGVLNVGDYYRIGGGGDGTLNVNGGQVDVASVMYIPSTASGSGDVNIVDGTVTVGSLEMLQGSGLIDIATGNGKLVVEGDATSLIKTYVDKGMITGNGTPRLVNVDYDGSDTTVTADAGADLAPAYNPTPARDEEGVAPDVNLTWHQGVGAASHDVYLGTNFEDVNNGTGGTYKGNVSPADANSYGPLDLKLGTTYYWRIKEVNGVTLSEGEVWKFAVRTFYVLEGFEGYSGTGGGAFPGTLRYVWKDGYSWIPEQTGSNIVLIVEEDPNDEFVGPVRTGQRSMLFSYNNCGCAMTFTYPAGTTLSYVPLSSYSEIEVNDVNSLGFGSDWTDDDVKALGMYFYGDPNNDVNEQMYAAVKDTSGRLSDMVIYDEPNDLKNQEWQRWDIDLQDFETNSVDLSSIDKLYIGFGNRDAPQAGGTGVVYFDELRLYARRCLAAYNVDADLDGDCFVRFEDVDLMVADWLAGDYRSFPNSVEPDSNGLLLWYKFDEANQGDANAYDFSGNAYHGTIVGATRTSGKYSNALEFSGVSYVDIDTNSLSTLDEAVTVTLWAYGNPNELPKDCAVFNSQGTSGYLISAFIPWGNGSIYWDTSGPTTTDRVIVAADSASNYEGQWNHWAFTKDITTGKMKIYLNGELWHTAHGMVGDMTPGADSGFKVGAWWDGTHNYEGKIDDFRVYDYALSEAEIVYVLTQGTGSAVLELESPANLYDDEPLGSRRVNFKDFAVLADSWLVDAQWP